MLRHAVGSAWASMAAVITAAACTSTAFAAETFPIQGTSGDDVIEVRQPLGPNGGMVQVYINGDLVNYMWEEDRSDRVIKGGAGDDTITIKNDASYVIYGEAGEDVIQGGEHSDVIIGGTGGDEIKGGNGHDWIKGCEHKDHIEGGPGNDVIYGNGAEDTLRGGVGNDILDGGDAVDTMWGDDGDDRLYGENGDDHMRGGHGDDLLRGGSGDDWLRGDPGADVLIGESGDDHYEDSASVSASDYENDREAEMEAIEDDFGVGVIDYDREWTPEELGFLRGTLQRMPSEVFDMWESLGGKVKYHRKEMCQLSGEDEYSASGLTSTGIFLYDLNWCRNGNQVQDQWERTITHETGHAYKESPALTSAQWSDWRDLSGWEGYWPNGTPDPSANFVSEYAETNAKEDWAETFEFYFCEWAALLHRAPEKFRFINDIFGKYNFGNRTPQTVLAGEPTQVMPAGAPRRAAGHRPGPRRLRHP